MVVEGNAHLTALERTTSFAGGLTKCGPAKTKRPARWRGASYAILLRELDVDGMVVVEGQRRNTLDVEGLAAIVEMHRSDRVGGGNRNTIPVAVSLIVEEDFISADVLPMIVSLP